ncbi:GNAT family N-acetyltransferase [Aliikangiella sp. IMCC44653]
MIEPYNPKIDDLSDGKVIQLLQQHHTQMQQYSPPESVHALSEQEFFDKKLTFWSVSDITKVVACGALKAISSNEGEIKAMKTAATHTRKGIAEKILLAIIKESQLRKYTHLYLETGTHSKFSAAIHLYTKHGFVDCPPFGNYKEDPYSQFMCLKLTTT